MAEPEASIDGSEASGSQGAMREMVIDMDMNIWIESTFFAFA